MPTLEERNAYLENPYKVAKIYGNFSPFYVTIGICSALLVFIFVLNFVLGCCSRHKYYWQDRHTGNRWLVSLWTATPHQQPPLDLTELKDVSSFQPLQLESEYVVTHQRPVDEPRGYGGRAFQQQHHHHHHQPQHHHQQEEYVELHKRESDI